MAWCSVFIDFPWEKSSLVKWKFLSKYGWPPNPRNPLDFIVWLYMMSKLNNNKMTNLNQTFWDEITINSKAFVVIRGWHIYLFLNMKWKAISISNIFKPPLKVYENLLNTVYVSILEREICTWKANLCVLRKRILKKIQYDLNFKFVSNGSFLFGDFL